MRELQNQDMYILSVIADKMDFQIPKLIKVDRPYFKICTKCEEVCQECEKATDEIKIKMLEHKKEVHEMQQNFGIELIASFFRRVHKAQDEINQLLMGLYETDLETVKKMPIAETKKAILNILKQPGALDFFK